MSINFNHNLKSACLNNHPIEEIKKANWYVIITLGLILFYLGIGTGLVYLFVVVFVYVVKPIWSSCELQIDNYQFLVTYMFTFFG